MTPRERLLQCSRLFLDTAPVIYYVEENPRYLSLLEGVFDRLDQGLLTAVTSPITLAECLIQPHRAQQTHLIQAFSDLLVAGPNTVFVALDRETARNAAQIRAKYNLSLTDAFQLAASAASGCDAFLTNDADLTRVPDANVIVLEQLLTP